MTELRFYFDESVEVVISEQLAKHGIDAISAHSLDLLGADDIVHLKRAAEMGRVLCTYDDDFLVLASQGVEHAGILFAQQLKTAIGDWVKEIRSLHTTVTAEQARGWIFFVRRS